MHFALYATVVLWVLSPFKAVVFVAVQQGIFGLYLGCSFAPNHKGMPMIERDAKLSFVRRQVITARNVRGGWLATVMLGGLNYQIEHHLFPMMPRPNLVRAQDIVQRFCRDHDLPYCRGQPGRFLPPGLCAIWVCRFGKPCPAEPDRGWPDGLASGRTSYARSYRFLFLETGSVESEGPAQQGGRNVRITERVAIRYHELVVRPDRSRPNHRQQLSGDR